MITAATSRQLACNTDATYRAEQAAYRAYLNATCNFTAAEREYAQTFEASEMLREFLATEI